MAMIEDFSVFFDDDEFAVQATLTPTGGAGFVIFDENGTILDAYGIQHSGPAAICPTNQWPAVAIGNTLTIGAVAYTVRSALRIDDGGLTLLTLAR